MKHVKEVTPSPKVVGFTIEVVLGGDDSSFDLWRLRDIRRASMYRERLIITDMQGVQHTYKCYGRMIKIAARICLDVQWMRECGERENKELGELCKRLAHA